ncbi:MAG: hypothetical protein ACTSRP_02095 [Candidatus Helarchaeota archaeon]
MPNINDLLIKFLEGITRGNWDYDVEALNGGLPVSELEKWISKPQRTYTGWSFDESGEFCITLDLSDAIEYDVRFIYTGATDVVITVEFLYNPSTNSLLYRTVTLSDGYDATLRSDSTSWGNIMNEYYPTGIQFTFYLDTNCTLIIDFVKMIWDFSFTS